MNPKEIGKSLKKAREALGFELAHVSREIRIRDFYLEALENGEFDQLPSRAQVKGFIRSYARFLELDESNIFNAGKSDSKTAEKNKSKSSTDSKETIESGAISLFEKQFIQLGKELRERREGLELSLSEISEQTHIGKRYLQWIEEGQHSAFPSPTQARGMLNNYASFLGLEKEALNLFGKAIQDEFESKKIRNESLPPASIKEKKRFRMPRWLRRYLSADILVGIGLTSTLAIVFVWGLGQVLGIQAEQESAPTAPPLAEVLIPSPSLIARASATPIANIEGNNNGNEGAETSVPQITIQIANPGNVKVQIFPLQREWMRVTVDGQIEFEGRIQLEENYTFSGDTEIILYTGNAAAFRIFLNDQDLGVVGIEGEVIELLFSRTGIATPSPTAIPSETSSPSETPVENTSVDGGDGSP